MHGELPGVCRRQQRVEERPGGAQLVAAHEVLLVASDSVEQEPLVGVGDVGSLWGEEWGREGVGREREREE